MVAVCVEGGVNGVYDRRGVGRGGGALRERDRGEVYSHEGVSWGVSPPEEECMGITHNYHLRASILFPLGH